MNFGLILWNKVFGRTYGLTVNRSISPSGHSWIINKIISSLQVISDVMSPLFLAFMFLRTEYYPLSELFGDWFCYFFDYTIAICGFTGQFHSFFLASFRYICLFHDGFMFKYNISPKVIFFALTYDKSLLWPAK